MTEPSGTRRIAPFDWQRLATHVAELQSRRDMGAPLLKPLPLGPRVWRIGLTITDRVTGRARTLRQVIAASAMLEAVVEARSRLLARGYWFYLGPKGLAGDPTITEC